MVKVMLAPHTATVAGKTRLRVNESGLCVSTVPNDARAIAIANQSFDNTSEAPRTCLAALLIGGRTLDG